ncbi:hypothetical protein C9I98_17555 [Photobacterium sanctipauli]|uniref:DUF2282 domain-containing protein n=1 Tax=Photobacterium sanctipauli TaxID=1342794 RepID=A0A2T3NPI0_9GAMM|nr:hypothetical protein [Photobacterium sanctipauli]PSW18186.1 hypothetical protein C9I98_17555 [Photobacterium sanctipauli]
MHNKIVLSIAMTSVLAMNAGTVQAESQDNATAAQKPVVSAPSSNNGGKCASGKCGTEKIFAKVELNSDPQDKLVRARDGKCGLTGQGLAPEEATIAQPGKCAGGLCGQ